ncbi:DNA photolyase FAD-binding [Nitzschia inconspicua]|uniref:DNA photolyase FAD-binding n=1 Tax=Nitzschia inconspicua TaxID=303405 RepID=A0A9K3PA56_9STRA|nr:DNA photolyase FAD-binding [Nitzschia inconspicua]KAG7357445.1 DNA photolyase FAD-binding [Nitzschia inconspicua]
MSDHDSLNALDLSVSLKHRILCRVPLSKNINGDGRTAAPLQRKRKPFILYLPTVLLRKRHNPAFALACHLANYHNVPVVVLCTVLDDHHLSKQPLSPTVMTARRLAFTIEALQSCCKEFEEHGAGVAIRVHGPGARTPHHLSLCHQALAVVSDEPFVDPHRNFLRRVVNTCQVANVPCYTVDGSTTVPPKSKLERNKVQTVQGDIAFSGAPSKAWRWQQATDPLRKAQVFSIVRDGALDSPELQQKLPPRFFLLEDYTPSNVTVDDDNNSTFIRDVLEAIPSKWRDKDTLAPGLRPWTVEELLFISDCKEWAMTSWSGADTTVPPCVQTHGSSESAKRRWKSFLDCGLKDYAKRRNTVVTPHAVSRISCYLNLGVLSIFDVIYDVWQAKATKPGYSSGCQKFLDEVVKFREGSYVHTFAHPEYHAVEVLPSWARRHLESLYVPTVDGSSLRGYTYNQLESASTGEETWDAMQGYLVDTGELHNNARMTWGKTVVHWQARSFPVHDVLWQLVCLNDRFALDGLSPPSYGGLLWCFGWSDKPADGQKVSEKWSHRYRSGPDGFARAKEILLDEGLHSSETHLTKWFSITKKPRFELGSSKLRKSPSQSNTILSFFSPVAKESENETKVQYTIG